MVFCTLVNPVAELTQRVPIADMVDLKSRPPRPDEPWFPCKKGDWVILSDQVRAKVTGIFLEPNTARFILDQSGLDEAAADLLLAEYTRPRLVSFDDTLGVTLRGINFNPGAEPDEMVSIRIWASDRLDISCRKLRLGAIEDVRQSFARGRGPCNFTEFLVAIADRLAECMDDVIKGLED